MGSWKKFTAREILDRGLEIRSPIWHREYWDRFIRDRRHFERAVEYIHLNPVKAGLVAAAERWDGVALIRVTTWTRLARTRRWNLAKTPIGRLAFPGRWGFRAAEIHE